MLQRPNLGFILYTERIPAVNSWDNGRIWVSSFIPNVIRLLSHLRLRPNLGFIFYTERNPAVKSFGITAEFGFHLLYRT